MRTLALAVAALIVVPIAAQNTRSSAEKPKASELVARVYEAPASKFILKQMNGPDKRGFRVVFVHEGKRYTLDHNWWIDGVQIWVRRNGTRTRRPADALADENTDNVVDFGTNGKDSIFAAANHFSDNSPARGVEHKPYWQGVYDEALAALAATLDKKP